MSAGQYVLVAVDRHDAQDYLDEYPSMKPHVMIRYVRETARAFEGMRINDFSVTPAAAGSPGYQQIREVLLRSRAKTAPATT